MKPIFPRIAITDIKNYDEYIFCAKYCSSIEKLIPSVNVYEKIEQGYKICFDDGDYGNVNFNFWFYNEGDAYFSYLSKCTKYTFDEFSEFIEEQKQLNPEMFI